MTIWRTFRSNPHLFSWVKGEFLSIHLVFIVKCASDNICTVERNSPATQFSLVKMAKYSGSKRSKNKCPSVELSIRPSSYYNSPISVHHYTLTVLHFSFDNSLEQVFVSFYALQRWCSICKRQFIFHLCLLMTMRVLTRCVHIFLFLLAYLI